MKPSCSLHFCSVIFGWLFSLRLKPAFLETRIGLSDWLAKTGLQHWQKGIEAWAEDSSAFFRCMGHGAGRVLNITCTAWDSWHLIYIHLFCEFFQGDNIAANPCLNPVWEGWNKHLVWRMIVETPIFVWRVRCSLTNLASHLVSGEFHVWPFNFESCFFFVISNHRSTGYAWITYKKYPAFRGLASNLQPFFGRKTLPPKLPYFALRVDVSMGIYVHTTRMDGIYF